MATSPIITTNNLAFGFDRKLVVKDMSLEISQGQFIGIFGQNGSGKSTFLKTLLGQAKPISGELQLFGEKPKRGDKRIGYMPQSRASTGIAHLTAKELLSTTLHGTGFGFSLPTKKNQEKINKMLQLVNATELAERCINELSGGEQKRIYLAQALLDSPSLLLLDEPLANLDPRVQEHFITLLNEIKHKLNVTILMTAHNPNALLTVMDKALYFGNNKALMGTIDEVITSEALTALYETPIEVLKVRNRLLVLGDISGKETEGLHHYDQ